MRKPVPEGKYHTLPHPGRTQDRLIHRDKKERLPGLAERQEAGVTVQWAGDAEEVWGTDNTDGCPPWEYRNAAEWHTYPRLKWY